MRAAHVACRLGVLVPGLGGCLWGHDYVADLGNDCGKGEWWTATDAIDLHSDFVASRSVEDDLLYSLPSRGYELDTGPLPRYDDSGVSPGLDGSHIYRWVAPAAADYRIWLDSRSAGLTLVTTACESQPGPVGYILSLDAEEEIFLITPSYDDAYGTSGVASGVMRLSVQPSCWPVGSTAVREAQEVSWSSTAVDPQVSAVALGSWLYLHPAEATGAFLPDDTADYHAYCSSGANCISSPYPIEYPTTDADVVVPNGKPGDTESLQVFSTCTAFDGNLYTNPIYAAPVTDTGT